MTDFIRDKSWRMNNLYRVVSKDGESVPFKLNYVQQEVLDNLHSRNLILKARQLGMSTFSVLYLLDECIFNPNTSAGIVSYSLEHAQHIFKRIIGHALDTFDKIDSGVIQRSAREITFSNGSFLRVDTTLRGGAYQLVLVSEFGKTCARNPVKAEEVITGTLQAVPMNGRIIIESTGEGNSGFYADMINQAVQRGNDDLTELDYKLFFFPWFQEPAYAMKKDIIPSTELTDYFDKLEIDFSTKISKQQRNWYIHQMGVLGDKLKQEFPSTVAEAFLSSSDAYYFQSCIEQAYSENRMLSISPYDPLSPVYVAMDIGVNDLTVMVFFQVVHGEIRIIDYYADNGKGVDFYSYFLQKDKKYLYHTIFLPHDAKKRDGIIVENTYEREFRKLFANTDTKFVVLKQTDKNINISNSKIKFVRCVFNLNRVKELIEMLGKYRKQWSEQYGKYLDKPYHDLSCFIGETLVSTPKGEIRIDEIKKGDYVLTPSGNRKVLNVFKKKVNKLVRLETDTLSVTCTPIHKIFSAKGLVVADSLCYDDQVITLGDTKIWKKISSLGGEIGLGFKDYFLSMSQEQRFGLMDINTKKINLDTGLEGEHIRQVPRYCIDPYGCIITEKSLKNIIFITLMKINQTMKSIIWNSSNPQLILSCISQKKNETCLKPSTHKLLRKPKYGMDQKKAENGTQNMEENNSQKDRFWRKLVKCVRKVISPFGLDRSYALTNVGQNLEEIQASMMKKEFVSHADKNLNVINMQRKSHVLTNVEPLQVTGAEVYDLEIEYDHCYFANELLVSNSNYADAFIYTCQAVTHIETTYGNRNALEKHQQIVQNRRNKI